MPNHSPAAPVTAETSGTEPPAPATAAPRRLLQATTPSLGVRLWIEGDEVVLQTATEGGRGTASMLVLLPVEWESPSRIRQLVDLDSLICPRKGDEHGDALHFRWPATTLSTPFQTRFTGANWRELSQGQPWVLLLLLFDKPDTAQAESGAAADWLAAVKEFFKRGQSPAWLRRGLVYLDSQDVPISAVQAGAVPTGAALARAAQTGDAQADAAQGAPVRAPAPFTFALASCHYPAGLVDGTPQNYQPGGAQWPGPADAALLRLARRLDQVDDPARPSLLVLAGDQIYADATAGLFDPRAGTSPQNQASLRDAADWLRVPYQNLYGSVGAQSVLGRLRSFMVADDHEIDDNWEPLPAPAAPSAERNNQALRSAGRQAYLRYQRNLPQATLLQVLWQEQSHRGIPFFLADTRTERGARKAAWDPCLPRIMGCQQTARLNAWLAEAPERPAFFVSPSMLLPRRRRSATQLRAALHSDAWCGYPASLHALLARVCQLGRSNLVFLSGDEHLSCVVEATITDLQQPGRQVKLHSVHSSGLYAPYPFANAVPEEFALPDAWEFSDPADPADPAPRYRCEVRLCQPWAPGDGFALLRLAPPAQGDGGGDWQLSVAFDRAAAPDGACPKENPGPTLWPCPPLKLQPGPGGPKSALQ